MKLLLDTHVFLWFIADDPLLSVNAKNALEDENNSLYLSVASAWEMAIKVSIGKLTIPTPIHELLREQLNINQIDLLQIALRHVGVLATLPLYHGIRLTDSSSLRL